MAARPWLRAEISSYTERMVSAAARRAATNAVGGQPLDRENAERLAALLKVVSDPSRLQLLSMIAGAENGEACANDLVDPLGLRQPTISYHLRVMVEAGILHRERRGNWAWYSIVPDRLEAIADILR